MNDERCDRDRVTPYLNFAGMCWPNPEATGDLEWRLRYGTATREDLLLAASVMGAYRQLVTNSQKVNAVVIRNLRASDV